MMLMTALVAILLAGAIAGVYALNIVYKNKLMDTWAILFLELESQGNRILQKIEQYPLIGGNSVKNARVPDVVLQITGPNRLKKIQGGFPDEVSSEVSFILPRPG